MIAYNYKAWVNDLRRTTDDFERWALKNCGSGHFTREEWERMFVQYLDIGRSRPIHAAAHLSNEDNLGQSGVSGA